VKIQDAKPFSFEDFLAINYLFIFVIQTFEFSRKTNGYRGFSKYGSFICRCELYTPGNKLQKDVINSI